ncbi:hypothetical protein [Anaerovibrio lipolyticus]|uniref:hypothetical protein n=1 Tax=Anaerovibrio lipolyticus TaxID=82374 RepID=UPI0025EDD1B5|nr:hypothetical protein [Anaerovibrio lipolyticus]MBE6104979.1 hypothetical protein [Anaerovibrio lipolyticus]
MRRKISVVPQEQQLHIDPSLKAHMYVSIENSQEEKLFLEYFLKDDIVQNCYSNYSSGYDYMLSLNPQNTNNLDTFFKEMKLMLPSLKATTMVYGGKQLK